MRTSSKGIAACLALGLTPLLLLGCWPAPRVGDPIEEGDLAPEPTGDGGMQPAAPGTVGFSTLVTTVFKPSCGTSFCHEGNPPAMAPMSLEPANAYASLVNRPSTQVPSMMRVAPNDPSKSYLLLKLKGTSGTVSTSTKRMPLNKPALDPARIAEIEAWINRGAPND